MTQDVSGFRANVRGIVFVAVILNFEDSFQFPGLSRSNLFEKEIKF